MLSLTPRRSPRSDSICSSTGAIAWHGPHHSAQKSTSTGWSLWSTSWSKFCSVTGVTGFLSTSRSGQFKRPSWSRCSRSLRSIHGVRLRAAAARAGPPGLREQNRGNERFSFIDGPITANNPMGVHHAWGRALKDVFQRYKALRGFDQRYQNGFDCQGLWVEVEVEKELGLTSKRDIENLVPGDRFASIDKFVRLCKERVDKYARTQTEQSIRLGYWMDWDRTDADWAK